MKAVMSCTTFALIRRELYDEKAPIDEPFLDTLNNLIQLLQKCLTEKFEDN